MRHTVINNNRKSTADCLYFPRDLLNETMSHTHTKVQFPFPLSGSLWKEYLGKISVKSGRKMEGGGGVYSVQYKNISPRDRIIRSKGSITVGASLPEDGGRHDFRMVEFH
jgi:hypothetical protein